MNEIQIFNNPDFGEIRTLKENGAVLFCGKDVAIALGYSNTKDAIARHCRGVVKRDLTDSLGREQETSFIPESDLYRLVFSSKLPKAEEFTDWVTQEVLPTIRKTGSYTVPQKEIPDDRMMRAKSMLLNAKARAAKEMRDLWNKAGVEPQYQAVAMNGYYDGLQLPREALPASATALLDKTTIAANLGVLSKSGKPHAQAIGAIIGMLPIADNERTLTPYCRNGHDGVDEQFTESVQERVAAWLSEKGQPTLISSGGKSFSVRYK